MLKDIKRTLERACHHKHAHKTNSEGIHTSYAWRLTGLFPLTAESTGKDIYPGSRSERISRVSYISLRVLINIILSDGCYRG